MAEKTEGKKVAENFSQMFESFGTAMSEIFNDPKLKEKAKDLGKSVSDSAETFAARFKDEEVKDKFREFGKAAEKFGKSVGDYFKE
jgi:hypothetical protein